MISLQASDKKKSKFNLELAPLIDIIFILLIFFAVSSSLIIQQKGIKLQLPTAQSSSELQKRVMVSVDKHRKLSIDGSPTTLPQLQNRIGQLMAADRGTKIVLNADESVPYKLVVSVLDKLRLGGCYNIALQAEKPE